MNIVICEDDSGCRKAEIKIVDEYMKENNIEYKIFEYDDYNQQFKNIMKNKCKKIYILDIETPSASGIDIARDIRKYDRDSIIIFVTGHDEYGKLVLKRNIMCLSFINKFEDLKFDLRNSLKDACYYLNYDKAVKLNDSNVDYNIRISKILYITRDSIERKTVIKLENAEYRLNLSLKKVKDALGDNFVRTHKSCYVNKNRVEKINYKNKLITFDNGLEIDLLSNLYKKEMC